MTLPKWLYESLPVAYGLSGGASLKYCLAESTLLGIASSTLLVLASSLVCYLRYDHRSNKGGSAKATQSRPRTRPLS